MEKGPFIACTPQVGAPRPRGLLVLARREKPLPNGFLGGGTSQTKVSLKDLIRRLRENGITILLTSQALEPVEAVCDAVLILDNKRLLLNQTMAEAQEMIRASNVHTLEELLVKLTKKPQTDAAPSIQWLKA